MQLTHEAIKELQGVIKGSYGVEIDFKEVEDIGMRLLWLAGTLMDPLPSEVEEAKAASPLAAVPPDLAHLGSLPPEADDRDQLCLVF